MAEVWSVRGVDPRTRAAVLQAARQRNVSVAVVVEEAVERLLGATEESAAILQEIDLRLDQLRRWRAGRAQV